MFPRYFFSYRDGMFKDSGESALLSIWSTAGKTADGDSSQRSSSTREEETVTSEGGCSDVTDKTFTYQVDQSSRPHQATTASQHQSFASVKTVRNAVRSVNSPLPPAPPPSVPLRTTSTSAGAAAAGSHNPFWNTVGGRGHQTSGDNNWSLRYQSSSHVKLCRLDGELAKEVLIQGFFFFSFFGFFGWTMTFC